mgnify:CR=1 FL=1
MSYIIAKDSLKQIALNEIVGKYRREIPNGKHVNLMLRTSYRCEAIRRIVWSLTDAAKTTVLTRVLLDKLYPIIFHEPLRMKNEQDSQIYEERKQIIDSMLKNMEIVGDLTRLSHGRWLPSPLGLTDLGSDRMLLTGGVPTVLLNSTMLESLDFTGHCRCLYGFSRTNTTEDFYIPVRSLNDWLSIEMKLLSSLTETILSGDSGYADFESVDQNIFLYVPEGVFGRAERFQYSRWYRIEEVKNEGTFLAKLELPFGGKEYLLAKVKNNSVYATKAINNLDPRLLMYGIDLLCECPTTVEISDDHDCVVVSLKNKIPKKFEKLFLSLGVLVPNSSNKYYPRNWVFESSFSEIIVMTLKSLGVKIEFN